MTIRLTFFLLFFCIFLNAQSPYHLNWKQESIYLGVGLSLEGYDLYFQNKRLNPLSLQEVTNLDRMSINSFDRNATFNSSQAAKRNSDILLISSYATPFLFLSRKSTRKEWSKISILYLETALLTTGLTGLTKNLVGRIRPLAYNADFELSARQAKSNRLSFFSGHVSTTTSNFFFAAKVFSDYYPKSKWKPYVWGTAIVLPAMTGYFRVKAGKHYPTDVMTGYLIGGAIGILVPHLHRSKKENTLSIVPTSTGFYLAKVF